MTNTTSPFIPTTYAVIDCFGIYQAENWDRALELLTWSEDPGSIIDNFSRQVVARWDGVRMTPLQNSTLLRLRH